MFLLLQREVERRKRLLGDVEGNPKRKTMDRKNLIKDLHLIGYLLDELVDRTKRKQKRSRKIRKLLKLPKTVHNKARLTNYIKNGTQ